MNEREREREGGKERERGEGGSRADLAGVNTSGLKQIWR